MSLKSLLTSVPRASYPIDIMKRMRIISMPHNIDNDKTFLIGSRSYRVNMFSGDIDFFQSVSRKNKDILVRSFIANLRRIMTNLKTSKSVYFIEVKLGVNPDYELVHKQINELFENSLNNGDFEHEQIKCVGVGMLRFKNIVKRVGLLNLYNKYFSNINVQDGYGVVSIEKKYVENFIKELREYEVLRWTYSEIMHGIHHSGIKIDDAVLTNAKCNIECVSLYDGRFSEISNFFALAYRNGDIIVPINYFNRQPFNPDIEEHMFEFQNERFENLKLSLYKLIYSSTDFDYYKAIKRLVSMIILNKKTRIYNELVPFEGKVPKFLNNSYALLSSLKSELKCLHKLIHIFKRDTYSVGIIKNQISNIIYKMNASPLFDKKYIMDVRAHFDEIIGVKYNPVSYSDFIENLIKILTDILNEYAYQKLRKWGVIPMPVFLKPVITYL